MAPGLKPTTSTMTVWTGIRILGKTLDRIYRAGPKKFFSALVVRAIIEEEIAYHILHADTTARLVYGEYRETQRLKINHGYNKESRRDLKQYKLGLVVLVVNEDDFPIVGDILDGNLEDKSWKQKEWPSALF